MRFFLFVLVAGAFFGGMPLAQGASSDPVVVINASVVKESTWDITKLGFMAAASKITEESLQKNPNVLWAEFISGYEPFTEHFNVPEDRKGDVIASVSVWKNWKSARDFINSEKHSQAQASYSSMFEKDRTVKLAFFLDSKSIPGKVLLFPLARPRFFVEQVLSKEQIAKRLREGISRSDKFDPLTDSFDPREGPPPTTVP